MEWSINSPLFAHGDTLLSSPYGSHCLTMMSNKLYNAKSYRILNYVIIFLFTIVVRGQTACSFGASTNKGRSNITNGADFLMENLAAQVPDQDSESEADGGERINTGQHAQIKYLTYFKYITISGRWLNVLFLPKSIGVMIIIKQGIAAINHSAISPLLL